MKEIMKTKNKSQKNPNLKKAKQILFISHFLPLQKEKIKFDI